MRYIDLSLMRNDVEAQIAIASADAAQLDLLAAPEVNRSTLITLNRDKWVAFRAVMERLYGAKCWYTESANPGTDDDIDHFRPKSEISECPTHDGYWWLALSWENFRLSCHRANRLRVNPESGDTHGKGTHFPLVDETARWLSPSNLNSESPALLDPTDPSDPPILTFHMNGRVGVAPAHETDAIAVLKVDKSRIYLHLDWPDIVSGRRDVYAQIAGWVAEGDGYFAALPHGGVTVNAALKAVARHMIALGQPLEPYSRAAVVYIHMFRDRDWVKKMVLPNIAGVVE